MEYNLITDIQNYLPDISNQQSAVLV